MYSQAQRFFPNSAILCLLFDIRRLQGIAYRNVDVELPRRQEFAPLLRVKFDI